MSGDRESSTPPAREPRDARTPGVRSRAAIAIVLAVLALGIGVAFSVSEYRLERRHRPVAEQSSRRFAATVDGELIERGRHLVTVVAQCTHCHGSDLGGRELADDPWIGRLHSSNLTGGRGGVGGQLSDGEWEAALRRGVARTGRSLVLMPSAGLAQVSDRDLEAVVAYIRQVPPVDRVAPPRRVGWLTRVLVAIGFAPDLLAAEEVARLASRRRVEPGPSRVIDEGEYLVALAGCRVCHRADLAGGLHPLSLPGEPVPPDLTRRGPLARFSREDFARAMREGRTPDGRQLDREFMPWPAYAGLGEHEIDAIWRFLEALPGT